MASRYRLRLCIPGAGGYAALFQDRQIHEIISHESDFFLTDVAGLQDFSKGWALAPGPLPDTGRGDALLRCPHFRGLAGTTAQNGHFQPGMV